MLFFTPKPSQFVGVDLGSGGVKLVEMRSQNNRPYLYTYGFSDDLLNFRLATAETDKANEVAKTADMLKAVAQAAKTSATTAVASLPRKDIFSKVLTIPQVDAKIFAATVAREVEKLLSFPLAEAVLDTRKLPPTPAEAETRKTTEQVFVVAARRGIIQMYTDIFSKAGFSLQSIETETFAAVRSLLGTDPSPVILIDMGKIFTSFSYVERGVPLAELTMEIGGDKINEILAAAWKLSPAEVENRKMELFENMSAADEEKLAEVLRPIYQPITEDIKSLLTTMASAGVSSLNRPDKIILTGGAANCPLLTKKIEQHFSIKTYVGDPWTRVMYPPALKPVLEKIAPRFAVAIGLAERSILN